MKKITFIISLLLIITTISFAQENQSTNLPNYNNGNGTILQQGNDSNGNITIRKHEQTITIGDLASNGVKIVYSDTSMTEKIYTLKDDDVINISEIWYITPRKLLYKIQKDDISGFIWISKDPYRDNNWEIIETFNTENQIWTSRKMIGGVTVWAKGDTVDVYDKPGLTDAKVIGQIPGSYKNGHSQININTEAITEETKPTRWVKVSYEGISGWVDGIYLSVERGGPRYQIPEVAIWWELGWF